MKFEVAVPTPVEGTFTYSWNEPLDAGTRVVVPFGRRSLVGVVVGNSPKADPSAKKTFEIKEISRIVDSTPVYGESMLQLARWMSTYYMYPLGEVMRTMLPASSVKTKEELIRLTPKGLLEKSSGSDAARLLKKLFPRKDEVKAQTLRVRINKVDGGQEAYEKLTEAGYIESESKGSKVKAREVKSDAPLTELVAEPQQEKNLTEDQESAYRTIRSGLEQSRSNSEPLRPYLLHGVTGSGKTEVYLHLIRDVIENGGQCLVLVPEISLTPQMTRVFSDRFPGKVAVVHSAMSDVDRWEQLGRIRSGKCSILIGPRSAVFGPFQNLKLLVVDEEHDSSYKQSTGLTYNGRDIAVVRGKFEGAVVVLGSATPSMESFHNAATGKYHLVSLPQRVTGRALPDVTILKKNPRKNRVGTSVEGGRRTKLDLAAGDEEIAVEPEILEALEENRAKGNQAIVLVNRRGYAYYLFSLESKSAVQCPQCSISLTIHARSTILRCHYCDYSTTVQKVVEESPDDTFVAVGYGSQKAEDHLSSVLPEANIVRLDSDTVVKKDYLPQTLEKFRNGEIDILVGTQILAKGHDFPNVTLIVILEVDQLLNLPDFRAGERTYQLVVQAAGRAGRAEQAGKVLIQSVRPEHPLVQTAVDQDYAKFAETELDFRKCHGWPPFSRLIAIEFNSTDKRLVAELGDDIDRWLDRFMEARPELFENMRILGPSIPPIETIRGRHRRNIVFSTTDSKALHVVMQKFRQTYTGKKLKKDLRLKIDVDPQSLI